MANVLVVDDIRDVADSFAELISLFGHSARSAYSAADATREIESNVPDVVLLDIGMPDIDGLELAREIRRKWGPRIRLVAHTAYPRASVVSDIVDAGFDSFISKSAQPLQLALALQGRGGMPDLRTNRGDRRTSHRRGFGTRRSSESHARFAA